MILSYPVNMIFYFFKEEKKSALEQKAITDFINGCGHIYDVTKV